MPEPELYDIETDPGERRNLYGSLGPTAERLSRRLEALAGETDERLVDERRRLERVVGTLPGQVSARIACGGDPGNLGVLGVGRIEEL